MILTPGLLVIWVKLLVEVPLDRVVLLQDLENLRLQLFLVVFRYGATTLLGLCVVGIALILNWTARLELLPVICVEGHCRPGGITGPLLIEVVLVKSLVVVLLRFWRGLGFVVRIRETPLSLRRIAYAVGVVDVLIGGEFV